MSNTIPLAYDILVRDRGGSTTFNRVGDSAESAGKRTNRAGMLVKRGALAMATGIGSATLVAMRFAKAAADDEVSATKMAVAFRNNAKANRLQIAATEAWITKMGLAYGVSDEELRPALGRLVAATHNVREAQTLTSLAYTVAIGRNKSLSTVTEALAKARQGNIAGLARLGVQTKDVSGKTLTFDQITKNLARTYKGQAASAADTTVGKYKRVKVAFEEAGESLGYKFMGPLTTMATFLTGTGIPVLDNLTTALKNRVDGAVHTVSDRVTQLRDAFKDLDDLDGQKVGENIAKIFETGVGKLGSLTGTLFEKLDAVFGDIDWVGLGISIGKQAPSLLLGLVAGILNFDIGGLLSGVGDHWFDILLGVLTIAFAPAKFIGKVAELLAKIPLAGKLLSWMLKGINGVGGRVKGLAGELLGWFRDGFVSALGRTGPGIISRFFNFLRKIPGRVLAIRGELASKLANLMRSGALAAGEKAGEIAVRVGNVVRRLPGKIRNAIPNPKKILSGIGGAIVDGLVSGLKAGGGKIVSAAKSLANKIPGPIRKVLGIFSPSRVAMRIGEYFTEGLALGLIGSKSSQKVDAAVKKITSKVKSLKAKLAALKSEKSDFAGGFNFSSSVFGADYGEYGPSTGGILAYAKRQLAQANQVKGDIAKLVKMGLSPSLIRQLQSAGPEGIAAMHQLANSSGADIAQLNALDKATQSAYAGAGKTAAGGVFGGQISAAQQQINALTKLAKAVDKLGNGTVHIHLEGKDIVYSINKYNGKQGKK